MELQAKFVVIYVIYFLQGHLVKAQFCGTQPTSSCQIECYDGCMASVNREDMTREVVKERIGTQMNLCMDKCYAREFLPLKSEDIPLLPKYFDAFDCLGRCTYPANKTYCFQGYLSSFFYCDCHHCCLQKPDSKKCVRACHLWFLRQWSPKPKHSCRYREELQKSPKTWCTDFCIFWTLHLFPSLTWDDVPKIKTSPCINRCMESMAAGAHLDYETEPVPCTDISKCLAVAVFQFKIVSTSTLTYQYAETKIGSHVLIQISPASASNSEATLDRSKTFSGSLHLQSEFDVHRDPVLERLHNLGYNVFREPGTENRTENPRPIPIPIPIGGYAEALNKAYEFSLFGTSNIKTRGYIFKSRRRFEIDTCSTLTTEVEIPITHDFQMDHEVNVKVFDKSTVPMPATELRSAIALKSEWNGLRYVTDLDYYTIVMKGKGHAMGKFGIGINETDTCNPIQGCSHPKVKPNAATACRKINDSSVLDGSGFYIDISYRIY